MAWLPDITVADIRAECAVITVGLKDDLTVQAAIDGGKAYIESILRGAGYDTTNPATDLSVRDAALAFSVARLLSSIYGSEQWSEEVAGAPRGFWSRVRMFIGADGQLVGVPNLRRHVSTLTTNSNFANYWNPLYIIYRFILLPLGRSIKWVFKTWKRKGIAAGLIALVVVLAAIAQLSGFTLKDLWHIIFK
jgi:hypothetical protein